MGEYLFVRISKQIVKVNYQLSRLLSVNDQCKSLEFLKPNPSSSFDTSSYDLWLKNNFSVPED